MIRARFSFRTQILLVCILCLGMLGIGIVLLNTFLIARLKEDMRERALLLAEETAGDQIRALLLRNGKSGAPVAGNASEITQQVQLVLRGKHNLVAFCLLDPQGNVILSDVGHTAEMISLQKNNDGVKASLSVKDLDSIEVQLRRTHPELRRAELPVDRQDATKGNMQFLISETGSYKEIDSAARSITKHLWSVLLAFTGVLALGLYLMARSFRRQLRLLQENERLDRMAYVGTLASGLAHEIRNPLNAMAVNLTVAEEEAAAGQEGSGDVIRRALDYIQKEVNRLNRSVTHFMEFALPETHRREEMDLRPLVEEVLELLKPQIKESGVQVTVDLPEEARLEADFSGLRQVLYNVVLNAVQAMSGQEPGERRLSIGGRRESAQWFLWIDDTGEGIPAGEEKKVFEVFHSTKAAGSGFGLAIARAIIKSHDGEIAARRREQGGTRIEITLPETGRH
jgi:signal transduction histidine kinase